MKFSFDASDLLRWAVYCNSIPLRSNNAMAQALNIVGDGIVSEVIVFISTQTGIDRDAVNQMLHVSPANSRKLDWELDASAVAPPSQDWSRAWVTRDDTPNISATIVFGREELVKIITKEDGKVCQRCLDAATASPYPLTVGQALIPIHPHCRCRLGPWETNIGDQSAGTPEFSGSSAGVVPQLVSLQLLRLIPMQELRKALSVSTLEDAVKSVSGG